MTSNSLWLEVGKLLPPEDIEVGPRVGVAYAGPEWALAPLRFFQSGCGFVSRAQTQPTSHSRTGRPGDHSRTGRTRTPSTDQS